MSAVVTLPSRDKSWLDRSLSLFTDVRAGEGVGVLLLATNIFFVAKWAPLRDPVQ